MSGYCCIKLDHIGCSKPLASSLRCDETCLARPRTVESISCNPKTGAYIDFEYFDDNTISYYLPDIVSHDSDIEFDDISVASSTDIDTYSDDSSLDLSISSDDSSLISGSNTVDSEILNRARLARGRGNDDSASLDSEISSNIGDSELYEGLRPPVEIRRESVASRLERSVVERMQVNPRPLNQGIGLVERLILMPEDVSRQRDDLREGVGGLRDVLRPTDREKERNLENRLFESMIRSRDDEPVREIIRPEINESRDNNQVPIRPLNEYRLMESSTREYRIAESRVHTRAGNNRNEWTIDSYSKDISGIIQQLDLKKVVLVGFSLGGPIL